MAKTKTPFFSMGAHGSVGESITAQKRNSATLVREKPLPTDPYSLAQAYQRWQYQDYAHLWTIQSVATRQLFQSAGVRHHLTGFQYWMKTQLAERSDLGAQWRLDRGDTATITDSSPHTNTGAVFGASPADGRIQGALAFDGINNWIQLTNHDSFLLTSLLSFEAFIKTTNLAFQYIYAYRLYGIRLYLNGAGIPGIELYTATAGDHGFSSGPSIADGLWHHYLATYDTSLANQNLKLFIDGTLRQTGNWTEPIQYGAGYAAIGRVGNFSANYFGGSIDNVIIYNRALDAIDAQNHAERRYPPQ